MWAIKSVWDEYSDDVTWLCPAPEPTEGLWCWSDEKEERVSFSDRKEAMLFLKFLREFCIGMNNELKLVRVAE